MTRRSNMFAAPLLLLALATSLPAHAAWKVLGVIKADKGLDRDEVTVSAKRAYRQIKLKADAADVDVLELHLLGTAIFMNQDGLGH